MFFFRTCPKCRGDMVSTADGYGPFVYCFQCGLIRDPAVTTMDPVVNHRISHGGRPLGAQRGVMKHD